MTTHSPPGLATSSGVWLRSTRVSGRRTGGMGVSTIGAEVLDRRELSIPGTNRVVQATFPDGTEPVWTSKLTPRQTLAAWMTG
jgi:hypothetical protein